MDAMGMGFTMSFPPSSRRFARRSPLDLLPLPIEKKEKERRENIAVFSKNSQKTSEPHDGSLIGLVFKVDHSGQGMEKESWSRAHARTYIGWELS